MKLVFQWMTPARISAALFILWCVFGVVLFRDYAVSWDEPAERTSGICSDIVLRENIAGRKVPRMYYDLWQGDRFYGMAFQHVLLCAENVYTGGNVNPGRYADRNIWYLRHFINFFAVTVGLVALYFSARVLKLSCNNPYYPILTVAGFMLMPRFFAESFYNVKDMILLAGFMLAGYCLFNMMKKRTLSSIAIFAFMAAFVSAIRLQGAVFYLIGAVRIITWMRPSLPKRLVQTALFTLLFAGFLILFYPVSWENPVVFFVDAVKYMSSHPWRGHVLFMGEKIISTGLPWYYIAVWMAITVPVPLILLGITGTADSIQFLCNKCTSLKKFLFLLRSGSDTGFQFQIRILMLSVFWGGLCFFSFFSKVFYNGWRHYYFLAWPLLFLIADGACFIWQKCRPHKILKNCAAISAVLFVIYIAAWNINAHPYQNCYFNILAGDPNGKFETDYWRLSNLDAFRKIVEYSKVNQRVSSVRLSLTCYNALTMLPAEDYGYIKVLNPEDKFEFYVFFDKMSDKEIRKEFVFEERYCSDLFGKKVHLYTTLKLR